MIPSIVNVLTFPNNLQIHFPDREIRIISITAKDYLTSPSTLWSSPLVFRMNMFCILLSTRSDFPYFPSTFPTFVYFYVLAFRRTARL